MMWLRQSGHEILTKSRDGHQCRVLLRLVPSSASLLHQACRHASQVKRPRTARRQTSYYEVLKISPKATQAQVKDAYYELSKKYHPDQYKGNEDPTERFREIKEAYEVLGNFSQRKMYDKGLIGLSTAATPTEAEEYSSKFYGSRRKRSSVPYASGKTPIYDFDEWSKSHYDFSRTRRDNARKRYEDILRQKELKAEMRNSHTVVGVLLLFGTIVLLHYKIVENHDEGKTKPK